MSLRTRASTNLIRSKFELNGRTSLFLNERKGMYNPFIVGTFSHPQVHTHDCHFMEDLICSLWFWLSLALRCFTHFPSYWIGHPQAAALLFLIHYWGNLYGRSSRSELFPRCSLSFVWTKENSAFLAFSWKTFCTKKASAKQILEIFGDVISW